MSSTTKFNGRATRAAKTQTSCNDDEFVDGGDLLSRVGRYLDLNLGTLCFTGPPGTGKTTLVQQLAAKRNKTLHTVIASDITANELLGRFKLRGLETFFVPGVLTRAVRNGDWFYCDEVLHAENDVLHTFHSLIDFRRELYVPALGKSSIKAHPDFRLVLSYNPIPNGRDLNRPFRDRLIMIPISRLDQHAERALLLERCGITKTQATYLTTYASLTREVSPSFGASTRQLLQAGAAVASGVSLELAAEECILNGVAGCNESLRTDILNRLLSSEISSFASEAEYGLQLPDNIGDLNDKVDA